MKTFTFLSFVIGIVFSISSFAQSVPNGDFEEWETGAFGYDTPVNWFSALSLIGSQDVFKVTPGHSGNYAAELKPVQIQGISDVMAASIFTLFPVTEKFANLSGYIKGISAGNDTLNIWVVIF